MKELIEIVDAHPTAAVLIAMVFCYGLSRICETVVSSIDALRGVFVREANVLDQNDAEEIAERQQRRTEAQAP